ncbi:MAG: hypothetical protein ACP5N3_04420 [Candidatus Nanoarchaeia archaeon]
MVHKDRNIINNSAWIQKGRELGINLDEIFYQDKTNKIKALKDLNLPTINYFILPAKNYKKEEKKLIEFIDSFKPVFSRLNPLKYGERRPYNLDINSIDDLFLFVETSGVKLSKYELHLEQRNKGSEYGGSIIRTDEKTVGEIIRGEHINLIQGWENPLITMIFEYDGFKIYSAEDYSEKEKKLLLKAIRMTYKIKGYFEFIVVDDRMLFKNYQSRGGFTKL